MEESKTSVNSSSIIDLKAELFRKQEEFKQQKLQNSKSAFVKAKPTEKKQTIWSKQNRGILERSQKDLETKIEEENVLDKSKKSLEAKAEIYKKLTKGTEIPEEDGSQVYLVDFQKKVIDDIVEKREEQRKQEAEDLIRREEEILNEAVIPPPKNEGDEWVDYVDVLGRSRRCMKKDLPELKKQDRKLTGTEDKQNDKEKAITPELLSNDMRKEILRQKWEEEERAAMNQPIHYSNVQFDEIRTHGVGFYQFDKNDLSRQEQMETLSNLRQKTKDERDRKDRIKEKRKAILDARLAKVKQRKLKREGKGMFGPDFHQDAEELEEADIIGPKLNEKDDKTVEEKKEMIKEPLINTESDRPKRATSVREWDKGKEKLFPVMSQDNYFKDRRNERLTEFAPPSFYYKDRQNLSRNVDDQSKMDKFKGKQSMSEVAPPKGLYQCDTSKSSTECHEDNISQFLSEAKLKSQKPVKNVTCDEDNKTDVSNLSSSIGDISSIPLPQKCNSEKNASSTSHTKPVTYCQPFVSDYAGANMSNIYNHSMTTQMNYPLTSIPAHTNIPAQTIISAQTNIPAQTNVPLQTNIPVQPGYYGTLVSGQSFEAVGNSYHTSCDYTHNALATTSVPQRSDGFITSYDAASSKPCVPQSQYKAPVTRYNIVDPRLIQNDEALETTPDNFTPVYKNS